MPDFVKIINKNDKPFDFHQSNRKRILQPGEDAIIPWGLACSLFGHPSTLNIAPHNEREKLYAKVRARFNYTLGIVPPEAHEMNIKDSESWWEVIRPRIDVFDLETNEQIFMVIDDPEGRHMSQPPESTDGSQDIAAIMRQIQVLSEQVHKLTAAQQSQVPQPSAAQPQAPTPTADAPSGFSIPITHPTPQPSEDDGQSPPLDLSTIAAQVAAQVDAQGATTDSPQAVPSGDQPPKMPPRPGN